MLPPDALLRTMLLRITSPTSPSLHPNLRLRPNGTHLAAQLDRWLEVRARFTRRRLGFVVASEDGVEEWPYSGDAGCNDHHVLFYAFFSSLDGEN